MSKIKWMLRICALVIAINLCASTMAADGAGEIRLVVRIDDMGVAQSVNEACIKTYREGIARSVEVIVPGPWFLDAVRLLKENPDLDVGVHLCLTSEWARVKWRPLTRGASLVDENGYFYPMTSKRADFPPNTSFLDAKPKLEEVEAELRAQIEMLKKQIPRTSHVSAHMGAATATPELRALTEKLAKEYGLRLERTSVRPIAGWSGNKLSAQQKEQNLISALEKIGSGQWMILEHPGLDTPEMRAIGHKGYENVAEDRVGVTAALTSDAVKKVIRDRGIKVISYAQVKD
jgi:predicted glycoside hydrolase/deacetylase ChbG (UPF0249 family)